jgi:hypothetical protein
MTAIALAPETENAGLQKSLEDTVVASRFVSKKVCCATADAKPQQLAESRRHKIPLPRPNITTGHWWWKTTATSENCSP